MHLNNINNVKLPRKASLSTDINNYFIQIDYFDKSGVKKYDNNIPLKYVFNQKILNKIQSN
jgi:hypothetical protein